MKRNRLTRTLALLLAFTMVLNGVTLKTRAEEEPGVITRAEFHMTDSYWTDEDSTLTVTRHPSVWMNWTTAGLEASDGSFSYKAELYVAPYTRSRVMSILKDLADMNHWAEDNPKRGRISGMGNDYWSAALSEEDGFDSTGGTWTGVLYPTFMVYNNACVQEGDPCCWQLILYRVDAEGAEVALQSEITDAVVDYSVGLPYMTAAPEESYASLYSETYYNWAESLQLEPTEDIEYEAEFYVWPGWYLTDPYESPFGWINTLPWSEDPDFNVLMANGMWPEDLYWFDNTGSMDEITPAPGMKVTMGAEIYALDRSGGGFSYSLYRRLPVVEFALDEGGSGPVDTVRQPSINISTATYNSNDLPDIPVTKDDGDFTFDGLLNDGEALAPGIDYTVAGDVVTVKKEYLATLAAGQYTITFHYTGLAGENGDIPPVDPSFSLTIRQMCRPVLTVTGYNGTDITEDCEVSWYNTDTGSWLYEPFAVTAGTTLRYYISPGDGLMQEGLRDAGYLPQEDSGEEDPVQYYKQTEGEVTLTQPDQKVLVALPQMGRVQVVPVDAENGEPLPNDYTAGYEVTWYAYGYAYNNGFGGTTEPAGTGAGARPNAAGGGDYYHEIGWGTTSPLCNVGVTIYYTVTMTGENAQNYPDAGSESIPVDISFGKQLTQPAFSPAAKASPALTVMGAGGADVTDGCTVVWQKDYTTLEYPFTVNAGTTVTYTVTPQDTLMIDGVQYYISVSGSVTLNTMNQPVQAVLGQQGSITVVLTDAKTGEALPYDPDSYDYWQVTWYGENGYWCGSEPTTPLREVGETLTNYYSLYGANGENYYTPDKGAFVVTFGNRVEQVPCDPKVPELPFYEIERRLSYNEPISFYRTDNGYTFDSIWYGDTKLEYERDYEQWDTEIWLRPQMLTGLGVGTHVFTFHYAETTAEDDFDTRMTVTITPGDITEVRYQARMNSGFAPTFYYTGEPFTFNPLLYAGSWANDDRRGQLYEGVDYVLSFENNVNASTEDNKAKVIITGIGNYSGTRTEEFTIKPCEINNGYADFEVVPNWDWPYLYDGDPKDMTDVSVYSRGKLLVEGVDYEIYHQTWNGMKEEVSSRVGSPTATTYIPIEIHGIGNYTQYWDSNRSYADEAKYCIMPHVDETVSGQLVLNPGTLDQIIWSWELDPEGNLTVNGTGEMPDGFSSAYWVGGNDPEHYYIYGWRHDYTEMIRKVVVTGNVTSIEANAFWNCTNLIEAVLPDTVEIIRASAFDNCRSLRSVHVEDSRDLPSGLRTVQTRAFGINTYNLEIHLPDNVTTYEVSNVPSSRKLYCKLGTTTHETLKALGASGEHIIEGYDNYVVEYKDNYNLGGTYTVSGYLGHGGEERLPDFIDSITHYDIFGQAASLITKLTIPGNIKILNGDAFRFLDNCREIIIEPGEMETLIRGLLNGHSETFLTIPDTVTTMPDGDFAYFYYSILLTVGEGSAALDWALAQGYQPDDGSNYGKLYRIANNTQPYIRPLTASVPVNALTDITATKSDGIYTFDSLRYGDETLIAGTDYTVDGNTVTIKAAWLAKAGIGVHTVTFHYTAGAGVDVAPNDPVMKITVLGFCSPVLTVYGYDGEDITENCTVVWKNGSQILEEPISVLQSTTLTYTVTPNDALMIDGAQYYTAVTGEVTFEEPEQKVAVELGRRGTITLAIPDGIPDGYGFAWYDANGSRIGTEALSPMADEGATLYYSVTMTGENAEDYYSIDWVPVTVGFGPKTEEVLITAKNNLKINVSGTKRSGGEISAEDYTVYWYVKDESGAFVYTGRTGNKLTDLEGQNGTAYYYEIAPRDRYLTSWTRVYNWLEFRGVPLSETNRFTVTDAPQRFDAALETMTMVTLSGTVAQIGKIGKDNLKLTITQTPWSEYESGGNNFSYWDTDKELSELATASIKADGTFEFTVYDCAVMIKLTDQAENFNTLYKSIRREELSSSVTLDMEARPLPETLFLTIKCVYPANTASNTSSHDLYYGSEYSQGEFNNMSFTLYNETKDITVDPALYTVTPTKVNFADTAALAGIIGMGDTLTLTAVFNGDAMATMTTASDTLRMTHRYDGTAETRFDLSYTEYGRIAIGTEREGGYYPEIYAVYNAEGGIEYTGKIGTTGKLADGEYTVIVLRENNWFSAPATLEELYGLLDPAEYQIQTCSVTEGILTHLHFGVSPAAAERVLFDEGSGLNDLAVNSVAKEWVLVKLPYAVNKDLAATNPGRTYAVTVTTYTGGFGDTPVTVRYESGHLYGEAAKDKYISLYAKDKLTESTVKINYHDAYHLGTVHGFTLYTTETKGDIYFYVQADFAGTFTVTANGAMLRANGSVERSASLGTMTLTAVTGNTALNFSSDYLRTTDNGKSYFNYNTVWLYTEPNANVTLYMDDVAIAETESVSFGLASFRFTMDNVSVGSARTSSFKEEQPDWTLAGFHELYAETENGVRTPTAIMECVTKEQFTPAVVNSLNVSTYMDNGTFLNDVTVYRNGLLTNHYFSPSDTGHIFRYRFTANMETPDNVAYLYVLVYDHNGVEYAAKLEREEGKNTFVGTIEGERLLFTSWAIVLRSKDPTSTVSTALLGSEEDILAFLGGDTVITNPYDNDSTVKAEYERALAEAQAMADDGSFETEMSFYFDVYADLIDEIARYFNEEGFRLDDSEESIDAMLEFFGYTIGVAADVDYMSWGDDYLSAILPDGREMRARASFEKQPDGKWLYVAESVILPTHDDPDGYSQVQRVYYEEDDAAPKRSALKIGALRNGNPANSASILPTYDADAMAALQNLKNRFTKAYQNIANRQESGRDVLYWNKKMQVMETLNRTQNQHAVQTKTNLSMQARLADLRDLGPEKLGQANYDKVVSCLDKLNRVCDAASVSDIGTALSKVLNAAMNMTITGRVSKAILDMSKGYLAQKFEEKFGYEMPTSIMGAADMLARMYFSGMLSKEEAELFELLMELDRLATELGVKGNLFDAGNLKAIGGGNTRAITDPQGIVYEAVLSNPIEGATATLWERNTETGEESVWNAEEYGQINPQTTNASGMYQWYVPEGEWQVRITAPEGYTDNTSASHPAANLDDGSSVGWLPVMPVQMGINIPLYSTASPVVTGAEVSARYAELTFSLYMDTATLTEATVLVTDGENTIPCTVSFPDGEENPMNAEVTYARTLRLAPTRGRFEAGKTYVIRVDGSATAYNGLTLGGDYVSGALEVTGEIPEGYCVTVTDYTKGEAEASIDPELLYDGEVNFTVSCDVACVVALVTADGYQELAALAVEDGKASFTVNVEADTELVIVLRGDTNLDGSVGTKDATFVRKIVAQVAGIENQLPNLALSKLAGDANADGVVGTKDATAIRKFVAQVAGFTLPWKA